MDRNEQISVFNTSPKQLRETVWKALDTPFFDSFDLEKPTFLKINGNHDKEYPGSNTSRWFLDALLFALKAHGFRDITVIEGAGYLFSATEMIRKTRLLEICEKHGVPFLDYEDLPRAENDLPKMLQGGQLINVPIMHTHGYAVVSCATKNYFGLIPKDRWKYHDMLNEKLMELYEIVPRMSNAVTIVEGTVGQRGDSTRTGDPVKLDLIVVGRNTLAIDKVVSWIMGFSPDQIPLLKYAMETGHLTAGIAISGDYYSFDALPRYDFTFQRSKAKNLSIWLHQHPVTSFFLERQPFRGIFHKTREIYQDYIYYRKKNRLFSGEWMEYERELSQR